MLFNYVKKIIVEILKPWFMEHIWPNLQVIIKKRIIEAIVKLFKDAMDKMWDIYKKWQEQRNAYKENAEQNQRNYEAKAEEATSTDQADIYKAKAEVWREVAEMHRRDAEDSKHAFALMEKVLENLYVEINKAVDTAVDVTEVERLIDAKSKYLQALPPGR